LKILGNKRKISKSYLVFTVVLIAIPLAISSIYLMNDGIKTSVVGKRNEDLFSVLPFIVEKSLTGSRNIFSDWNFFFSEPFHVGDSNFYYYIHLLLYLMINNMITSYKIYIVIIFALSFFSMYFLAYSFADKNRRVSALIAAFFYALTPYFLFELVGHQYMMWSYALLPMTYYFIHRALTDDKRERTYTWVCMAGIFIALSAFYPMIQYVYINGIFLSIFSFLLCFKGANRTKLNQVLYRIIRVIVVFSIAFLLSAYFVLPMVYLQSPYSGGFTFARTLSYPVYSNTYVESTFLLNRGLRADFGVDYFNIYGIMMVPFALPLILSSLLITLKKKGVYLVFFLLGILGVFFSMGSNAPLFLRLFEYAQVLPYFSSIRTPCRFTIQVALSFSLLAGIALGEVASKLYKSRPSLVEANRHNRKTWLGLLALSVIIMSYLFSGYTILYSVAGPFGTQPISNAASKVVKWLEENDPNQDYRIIDLTQTLQLDGYHRSLARVEEDLVSRYYRSPSFAGILGLLNVKYIITEPDVGRPYVYWHSYVNEMLSNSPYFNKVAIDNITIHINKLAKPRIYGSNGALTLGGPNVLSTFYALIEGEQLVDSNTVWADKTFNSGWRTAEIVNTPSYGFETHNDTANLWITTTQMWPDYAGYSYDDLDINPNTTRYLVIRLKNDDNPASTTSIHLFDDLNTRLSAVNNVHFSNWTTLTLNLLAYTQRPIKRILIYTVESFNVSDVKLHTYMDYVAFLNESSQPSIFKNNWALFSTDFLNKEDNLNQTSKFNALVFHDSDLVDLTFLNIDPQLKLEALKYMNTDWRIIEDNHGSLPSAPSYQSSVFGQLVLSERIIYTDKDAELVVPFSIDNASSYDVWIRAQNGVPIDYVKWAAAMQPNTNVISTSIDGSVVGEADFGKVGGFKLIKVNDKPLPLSKGSHLLNLFTSGNPIYLDMIAVTPAGLIDSATKKEMAYINDLQHVYLLEFSNYFTGENAYREASIVPYTSDAWSGYLTLKPNSTITQKLFMAKDDNYALGLRLLQRLDSGILTLKIDGTPILNVFRRGDNTWTWINSDSIFLSAGEHVIEVKSKSGYNSIDLMYLIEEPLMSNAASEVRHVQYDEVQFDAWHGNLSFSKPTFVVFTESYYPEWVFQLQTENSQTSIDSLQVFYFLNAYCIDSTGSIQFTIHHETSQVRKVSDALSILTFVICIMVIFAENMLKKYV